ncbi:hypothetical protein KUTeg_011897 [Tegillarca granosa]|uniref:Carboxylesterase type B domain-containing protein n=1 Tax=Tegillarca granosa TaxID=220873 RepID=A0ABQ9F2C1_TEGGR|nr:hypothetical protein KUTeg_011897 [Tegillarca granosa]
MWTEGMKEDINIDGLFHRMYSDSDLILTSYTYSFRDGRKLFTCSGPVKGIVKYRGNKKIYNFRGIPYAKPPIGDLRFRKPEPIASWGNELDATRYGAPCVQMQEY